MYPGDHDERDERTREEVLTQKEIDTLKSYRELLAEVTGNWESQGAGLRVGGPNSPLTEEEKAELHALGYVR